MGIRQASVSEVMAHCDRVARDAVRLRPGRTQIAAIDADGALWNADAGWLLWDRLLAQRALHARAAAPLARAVRSLGAEPAREPYKDFATLRDLRERGACPGAVMARAMLTGLAGMEEKEVEAHAAAALAGCPELRAVSTGHAGKMIETLRSQGYRVVAASSSPRWVVEIAARACGIEPRDTVAAAVAVVGGRLTDDVIEPLPYGGGRLQAIMKACGAVPMMAAGSALADLEMLKAASHVRLLVDPSPDLLEACEREGGSMWFMRRDVADILSPPELASPARPLRAARARRPRPDA